MPTVTQQCVSLANGALSPDLRVNYEFGLVMGVNEFRQEQEYFLEKDYLYNRELHGYGTASGLKVTAARPPDNANEVLITVGPGMALDQWGRPIVVRNDQCARLGAWLAKREQQNPGEIASHRDPSGQMSVYVVASHDECPDALVPIPGQPCSSADALQAPSRIRDSFNIEFRWEPPQMPAWDAVRCFAKLLALVRIEPGLPTSLSDEQKIIDEVRTLDQPCTVGLMSSPPEGSASFHLPVDTAREALDRIFTVWVTEVRPKLLPNLLEPDPGGEAAILLTRIDFTPVDPFQAKAPQIQDFVPPDDEGRPFLLHTQLIQELLLLGSGDVQAAITQPSQELVTFNTLTGQNKVSLWFHTSSPVKLPATLQVQRGINKPPTSFKTGTSDPSKPAFLWDVTPSDGSTLVDKEFLAFAFDTDTILVGTTAQTLTSVIHQQPLSFVGYDGDHTINAFYEVENPPQPQPGLSLSDVLSMPTQPLVTITLTGNIPNSDPPQIGYELWFHVNLDQTRNIARIQQPALQVWAEIDADAAISIPAKILSSPQRNIFNVGLDLNSWREQAKLSRYLRFVFPVNQTMVSSTANAQAVPLRKYINDTPIKFEGYNGKDAIIIYVRVPSNQG